MSEIWRARKRSRRRKEGARRKDKFIYATCLTFRYLPYFLGTIKIVISDNESDGACTIQLEYQTNLQLRISYMQIANATSSPNMEKTIYTYIIKYSPRTR